jgi:ABC-2 type transport system permease protein
MSLLYFILFLAIMLSVELFLSWLESMGANFEGISPSIIPFYMFPDVWQNLAYLASFVKFFLAFIVIISITNEYSFRTIRQNIIDGMSPTEFLISKELMIGAFSLFNMLVLFISGTIMGLVYTTPFEIKLYFDGFEFLFVHFLEVAIFLNFAMLFGLLLKKAGFAIIGLCFYGLILEPGLVAYLNYRFDDHFLVKLFPIHAINNLVEFPYSRYIFMEVQDYVAMDSLFIGIGWLGLLGYLNWLLLTKRDV